jgi:hypothetical protein
LYSHPDGDGEDPLATEKIMAKIEGHYARGWPKFCDGAANARTRKNVARFVAFMHCRHPDGEAQVRRMNAVLLSLANGQGEAATISVEHDGESAACKVGEVLQGTAEDKDTVKSAFLRLLPRQIEAIADVLVGRRWGIVFSDTPAFATSDHPVVLHRGRVTKKNFRFRTPGTEVLFPINPSRLLAVCDDWPEEFGLYKCAKPDVFNRIIARGATRFVFFNQNLPHLADQIPIWRSLES